MAVGSKLEWNNLTIQSNPIWSEAAGLSVQYGGNASYSTQEYLGDAAGVPMQIVRSGVNPGAIYLNKDQITATAMFGEEVTLADGTKLTLMDLISKKLSALVATAPAPVSVPASEVSTPTTPGV